MKHTVIISDKKYNDLNPVQFGYEKCVSGHSYGPAIRTHWLIHYVVSGFGIFRINGNQYRIRPGEMFIIPPFVETYYEADIANPWNYIWIGFTTDSGIADTLPHTLKLSEAGEIFNAMKSCEDYSDGRSAYLSARLWDLFALIMGKNGQRNDYVKDALDCIHSEYMKGITIEEIASRLNLDRTYFYAIFKRKVGISPKQYLLSHRMNIAASLINDQKVSVSIAAYSVGYTDIFSFSKMFKKHFGVSPTQYAKAPTK